MRAEAPQPCARPPWSGQMTAETVRSVTQLGLEVERRGGRETYTPKQGETVSYHQNITLAASESEVCCGAA